MATNQQSKRPATKLRCGNIKATIWHNVSEKGPFFATTFSRPFKNQFGAWRNEARSQRLRDAHECRLWGEPSPLCRSGNNRASESTTNLGSHIAFEMMDHTTVVKGPIAVIGSQIILPPAWS